MSHGQLAWRYFILSGQIFSRDADGHVRFRGAENGFVGEHAVVIEGEHALSWACHEEGMP